ncbi:hypothetical protein J4772_31875 [Cohnella sp. LGH]|uniref:hypothetical protein n=1 Tax=Cohnella sp. LGH TaxID=1619153 RepID=UPI001ADABA7B|nr:hypothetical protein [Cohnella sp. LGH]QTH42054.1 hypothetical protein J4772_31875 [Cohnella sp. LGH]
MDELQKLIFNDAVLVQKLNAFREQKDDGQQEEKKRLEKAIRDTEREIENIVAEIAKGFTRPAFLTKVEET